MPEQPSFRDGRPGDVEAMAWAKSEEQRDEWRRQLARAELGEVDFLVAELDGHVVGKAVLDWTHNADGTPWLWLGSVDPDHRGRGIGALGLAVAEQRARKRGHPAIEMCVDDDNPRARELYECSGYRVVGPYLDEHDETRPDGSRVHVVSPGMRLRKQLCAAPEALTPEPWRRHHTGLLCRTSGREYVASGSRPRLPVLTPRTNEAAVSTATIQLPSVPCIHLRGDVDMSRLHDLADLLRHFQATDAASACVDLEAVTFMGSTCLAFLVNLRNECLERGGSVTLRAPTAVARHLLHLVGFDDSFEIVER